MEPTVALGPGRLQGREDGGVLSFKGIPYAAAPFGEHRFAAPVPPPSWDGVRRATEYGPTAPKPGYASPVDELLPEPFVPGEECLNLNVWTPALEGRRPVLVWIHGGSFVNGSGAVGAYDGSRFARDGVVCVTINYRLGVDGFAVLDGTPVNRGLLDQIAALQWVRDNIAAFGGDPDAVTVAGESAGAMSVTTLLTMPGARGLFHRAILQSGAGHHTLDPATAAKVAAALAQRLGVEPTAAGLAAVPIDRLVREQAALSTEIAAMPDPRRWGEISRNLMAYEPVVDGESLPTRPIEALQAGVAADIDVLIGTNTDEHTLFLVPNGLIDYINSDLLHLALTGVGADPATVVAAYDQPNRTPGELLVAAMTDWFFRIPAVRVAEARLAHGRATHVYEFAWPSPLFDGRLGACHGLEIAFAFDTLDVIGSERLTGPNPPADLAGEMHADWVAFVTSGDPGWPAYGPERTVRRFAEPSETVTDPRLAQRRVWDGIR